MSEEITELTPEMTGRYMVTTAHGTKHLIDLDNKTSTRYGAVGREWGDKTLVVNPYAAVAGTNPKFAAHYENLTPDGAAFHYNDITYPIVGKSMRLVNDTEWRVTSTIKSIEKLEDE